VLILLITVKNVKLTELKILNQLVTVNKINTLILMENVMIVTTDVLLVKVLLPTVLLVNIKELQLTFAHVQLDIMNSKMTQFVILAIQDVKNVKAIQKNVKFVLTIEFKNQKNVHVTKV